MSRMMLSALVLVAVALPQPGLAKVKAASKASAKKKPVATSKPVPVPVIAVVPAVPRAYMVPNEVTLRITTPAEAEGHAVWNLRAALNVAALQCQFSPFLATVKNYNDALKQHDIDFDRAQLTMMGHFKRYDGARALNSFDQYTTRTYNSFSTLDAQYSFCEAAATLGRLVLTVRQGQLGPTALAQYPAMRAALIPKPLSPALANVDIVPIDLPDIGTLPAG